MWRNHLIPHYRWLTRQAHQTAGRRVIIDCQESWQAFDLVTILKKVDEQS